EPLQRPAFGQPPADQSVDVVAPRVGAGHEVVEEIALGVVILLVLDGRPEPMLVELVEQARQRRALHLLLVKRLDRREAGGGARTGSNVTHAAGAIAGASSARKGSSAAATSAGASHGAK